MVNTSESALKIVKPNKRKWLIRLSQIGTGTEVESFPLTLVARVVPGR
jgi:hypothetical protein